MRTRAALGTLALATLAAVAVTLWKENRVYCHSKFWAVRNTLVHLHTVKKHKYFIFLYSNFSGLPLRIWQLYMLH